MGTKKCSEGHEVPVIPVITRYPERDNPANPVVAICGKCGVEWRKVMWYCCMQDNCPMQTKVYL